MIQLKAFPYLSSLLGVKHKISFHPTQGGFWLFSLQGMGGLFLCHAGALLLGAFFTLAFVPETRNKSLTQLEQIFKKNGDSGNKVWNDEFGSSADCHWDYWTDYISFVLIHLELRHLYQMARAVGTWLTKNKWTPTGVLHWLFHSVLCPLSCGVCRD